MSSSLSCKSCSSRSLCSTRQAWSDSFWRNMASFCSSFDSARCILASKSSVLSAWSSRYRSSSSCCLIMSNWLLTLSLRAFYSAAASASNLWASRKGSQWLVSALKMSSMLWSLISIDCSWETSSAQSSYSSSSLAISSDLASKP